LQLKVKGKGSHAPAGAYVVCSSPTDGR